jgi:DHA2 family multidrug resistance protein-like MFS transporter
MRLFRDRAFSGVVTANLLSVLGLSGVMFFLSQYFQLVHGYSPLQAGLAELPAAGAATVFGVVGGVAVRFWSQRAILATGLALVGVATASLTLVHPSTTYPQLGVALFVVGVGLGLTYTVANDVVLAIVRPERAGAAAGISETACEMGMALGIAMLGSIVAGVYRGLAIPPGILDVVAAHAKESLGAADTVAETLPADAAHDLLAAAQAAFTQGLAIAAGVGATLLLASAAAVWLLLKPCPAER